jgi:wyosine [tRNA(Phe)-imidazoG37] synthetase (radical SAM superfamily)
LEEEAAFKGQMKKKINSSVYGPVDSWRLGRSLGIDLLCIDSICSFDCVYCQLGKINRLTTKRRVFVPTEKLHSDLIASEWRNSDVITISGSGEPTLAYNLGEAIDLVRSVTSRPIIVLTNSTLLGDPDVRRAITKADRISCKLDAWEQCRLQRINRPVKGLRLDLVVDGISRLRHEFSGALAIQTMLLAVPDRSGIERYCSIVKRIRPDEIQLNLPSRPVPYEWTIENRGNIKDPRSGRVLLKQIAPAELLRVADAIESIAKIPVVTPPLGRISQTPH